MPDTGNPDARDPDARDPDGGHFDLVVLGSGTAGTKVATTCRAAGWSVAVVEVRDFGGTCALRGCEPKKVFWTVAEATERARLLAPRGVEGGSALRLDWGAAQAFKRSFTDPVPENREASLREAGIVPIHGQPCFLSPDTLAVGERRLTARHVLIATGAAPARLPIEGAGLLATSDDFLALEAMPESLVLVGGGYIAFECAHLAARAGARATIIQDDDRPLAQFEPELVARLLERTRALGIEVALNCKVERIARRGQGFAVECGNGRTFEGALVVHGLGRRPALQALGLEAGGVATEKGRLSLDPYLRSTSNPRVFAAGDAAAQGPALTPVASHDAAVVARNLLEGCHTKPDYGVVPSAVFTIPPMASVGLSEARAREDHPGVEVRQGDMAGYQSVRRTGETAAAYKLLVAPGSGLILGAHLLGPEAPEVINVFALAMRAGMTADDLSRMMTAYPSGGSNIASMLG
ncbi:pyridine nucleotide-disulfide oxidoreductase [Pseudoroseomonas rhizosphaerae]|uniref:Pyridine nucleotide-disulfide oxidoreductase n=1 Tax=Teichococcus rhizosphaerae TaxID=1335062 RepID=A0A2C7A7N5_9PROT|nr:NAD(P)/FAD-dependent oxidoreductase [Pseudoroseomonas rhizosphaerae]PHK93355.1 pyridine nucleotide-disulfide oxidoreductase [Pseudoroseomonas rhizosphaerae]